VRAGSFLIAVGAFAAGVLVGHLAAGRDAGSVRAREPRVETARPRADAEVPQAGNVVEIRAPEAARAAPDPSPDRDLPLDAGTEFARWEGEEFARWYAIHKRAWELPDLDEDSLERYGDILLALGRIPRRDVLLAVIDALRDLDRALAPIIEESAAWRAANLGARGDEPTALAFAERLRDEHQRCFDRLHRQLAYSDYLLLLTRHEAGEVERRSPPGGPLPGGDPYGRPVADAKEYVRFSSWYRAYRGQLGFAERDEDFLEEFHQHVVVPLGRLPEPSLMCALQEAYLAVYPRLGDRADWEGTVRDFFASLGRVLGPLDYERMRHSHEWGRACKALSIPEAPYLPAGR
jgi:hypothetical protein